MRSAPFGVGAYRVSTTDENREADKYYFPGDKIGDLAFRNLSCLAAQLTSLCLPSEAVLTDIGTICKELPQLSNLRHLDHADYDVMTPTGGESVLLCRML